MPLEETKRGDEMRVYLDSADNYSTPTWAELTTIDKSDYESTRDVVTHTARNSKYISNRLKRIGKKWTISGVLRKGDDDLATLKAAHEADPATELHIAVTEAGDDITTSGTVYDKYAVILSTYKETQTADDMVEWEAELILGDCVLKAPAIGQTVA